MIGIRKNLIFVVVLTAFLSTTCIPLTGREQKWKGILPEDQAFLESILSSLKSMTGEFEITVGLVYIGGGVAKVDINRFSGRDQSFFKHLGNIIDNHPRIAHEVISTLVGSLDDMSPTNVMYRGNAVPLGVMCYEALHTICYYEASDKDGNITAWEGTVLPGATEADLKTAKRAWEKILKKKAYNML
jgi:hypothetical protein